MKIAPNSSQLIDCEGILRVQKRDCVEGLPRSFFIELNDNKKAVNLRHINVKDVQNKLFVQNILKAKKEIMEKI